MKILDVRIDNLSRGEILQKIEDFLNEDKFHQIATVNPEFVLESLRNQEFKDILNGCDLNVADGFGIRCAFWKNLRHLKYRMTGVALTQEILKLADKHRLNIFLACRQGGLSSFEEIREAILEIYPDLKVSGGNMECHPRGSGDPVLKLKVAALDSRFHGNDSGILLCNFGAPAQEIFIKNRKNDTIRLAMGVGGSFDFLTGKIKRAPRFMRVIGLEWLYRLIQEPGYRWKRILRAVIVFPIRVIINR